MPNPDVYRQAIRTSGTGISYTVNASLGGTPVAAAQNMRPVGGSIVDTTRPGVRRTLNLELAATTGLYDALVPYGTQLAVTGHVQFADRIDVPIPMGVFD